MTAGRDLVFTYRGLYVTEACSGACVVIGGGTIKQSRQLKRTSSDDATRRADRCGEMAWTLDT